MYKRQHIGPLIDGHAQFHENGKRGYIDASGNVTIPAKFDQIHDFVENIAVANVGRYWGLIDRKGEWIVEPVFERMNRVRNLISVGFGPFGCYRGYLSSSGIPLTFSERELGKANEKSVPDNTPIIL